MLMVGRPSRLAFAAAFACFAATATSGRGQASNTFYITPHGAGDRDGSSWANAGTLANLAVLIGRAGPDGKVLLRADLGSYRTANPIAFRVGGAPGHPVTISGVDGSGRLMKARIVGTRVDPYRPDGPPGSDVFRLGTGANHLRFEHLSFRNQGNGCFYLAGNIRDLAIANVDATNVRRFIENQASGTAASASVDGLTVRDVEVNGFSKGAVRLRYDSRNILLENVVGDSQRQDGDDFAEGVALQGTVHDVIFRRVTMRNSHDTLHEYWNGDGFATERDTYNLRFEDTVGSGNTDAGYDLKSNSVVLVNALAEDNKHNFKMWGRNISLEHCIGRGPHRRGGTGVQDQIEILAGADVVMTDCRLSDNDPLTTVFHVQKGARLTVGTTSVSKDPAAKMSLVEAGGELVLD
jgi:hypothetical protein